MSESESCTPTKARSLAAGQGPDDVGVTGICYREDAHTVVAATGSAKLVVVAVEVMDARLRQHRVVLALALAERRAVLGDEDQLRLALAQGLEGRLVAQAVLPALHDQLQAGVDGVCRLGRLRLLASRHCGSTCWWG